MLPLWREGGGAVSREAVDRLREQHQIAEQLVVLCAIAWRQALGTPREDAIAAELALAVEEERAAMRALLEAALVRPRSAA